MLDPNRKLFRWGPISACPLFMYFTVEPAFAPLKNLLGICYPQSEVLFYDNKVLWVLDNEETGKVSSEFAKKIVFNKTNRKKYFNLWHKLTKDLLNVFDKVENINWKNISGDKLSEKYREFAKTYYDWWTLTMSLELATITIEPLLGEKLKSTLKDEKAYAKAFSVLASPLVLTFYRQEQKDLLKIMLLPKSRQDQALKEHQQKYFWIFNSYLEGKVLDLNYFKEELKKASNTDYKKILAEIENYPNSIKKEKEKIYQEIKPNKDFLELVELVETFSALQDERKKLNFLGDHYLEKFVERFSQLSKIDIASLKLLVLDELPDVLKTQDTQLLENRQTCFVLDCNDKDITHYEGENALLIANKYTDVSPVKQNIIRGFVASTGEKSHFRGVAKIVLTIGEVGKINKDDILVTTMTSPDFVIGMKKAGAFVTDTGGMLCHAAIVSRELKIPCIVGTEIATKIIHDGDVIELNCDNGTINVVKSSLN